MANPPMPRGNVTPPFGHVAPGSGGGGYPIGGPPGSPNRGLQLGVGNNPSSLGQRGFNLRPDNRRPFIGIRYFIFLI